MNRDELNAAYRTHLTVKNDSTGYMVKTLHLAPAEAKSGFLCGRGTHWYVGWPAASFLDGKKVDTDKRLCKRCEAKAKKLVTEPKTESKKPLSALVGELRGKLDDAASGDLKRLASFVDLYDSTAKGSTDLAITVNAEMWDGTNITTKQAEKLAALGWIEIVNKIPHHTVRARYVRWGRQAAGAKHVGSTQMLARPTPAGRAALDR